MPLTKVTSNVLADNAVTTGKILDSNVTTGKLATDSITTVKVLDANITTAKLAADSITGAKVGAEFTTSSVLTAAAIIDVDYTVAQVFTLTPTVNTTLNITNPIIGVSKNVVITGSGGALTLSFTVGGAAGTFNRISGAYVDTAAAKNLIQVTAVSATEFWYSISQIAV
jgi:hypothetical protein